MTRPNPNQHTDEPKRPRGTRDDQHSPDEQASPRPRSNPERASRELDVIPEGEDELASGNHDELGEDEDPALERE